MLNITTRTVHESNLNTFYNIQLLKQPRTPKFSQVLACDCWFANFKSSFVFKFVLTLIIAVVRLETCNLQFFLFVATTLCFQNLKFENAMTLSAVVFKLFCFRRR